MESPPSDLNASTRLALPQDAIEQIGAAMRRNAKPEDVRPLIRLMCEAARDRHMYPEQLLALFKTELARLPEAQTSDPAMRGFVSGVVTLCIAEYYGSRE